MRKTHFPYQAKPKVAPRTLFATFFYFGQNKTFVGSKWSFVLKVSNAPVFECFLTFTPPSDADRFFWLPYFIQLDKLRIAFSPSPIKQQLCEISTPPVHSIVAFGALTYDHQLPFLRFEMLFNYLQCFNEAAAISKIYRTDQDDEINRTIEAKEYYRAASESLNTNVKVILNIHEAIENC